MELAILALVEVTEEYKLSKIEARTDLASAIGQTKIDTANFVLLLETTAGSRRQSPPIAEAVTVAFDGVLGDVDTLRSAPYRAAMERASELRALTVTFRQLLTGN